MGSTQVAAPPTEARLVAALHAWRDVVGVSAVAAGLAFLALLTAGVVAATGALAVAGVAIGLVRARGTSPLLAGQAPAVALAVAALALAGGGLVAAGGAAAPWRPLVAIAAYPFLARGALRLLVAARRVREADVLVEGSLSGIAAGIAVHALVQATTAAATGPRTPWADAEAAVPAVLVGLDVALLVIGCRALGGRSTRRGPLALLVAGSALLFVAHVAHAVPTTALPTSALHGVVALALACFGATALHPAAVGESPLPIEEPALFSRKHATIVVVALVAAPTILAVQAMRQITVSTAVATGVVLTGVVLACHLVGLLQERATTEHRATHDSLTGLPNRDLFTDRLDRAIAHARRSGRPVAALFIDLDRFKDVNDTFGHAAGDLLLRTVAARLIACCRDEDTVARLSGDEFAILLPHPAAGTDAAVVAQRVLDALAEPVSIAGERMLVVASIGIAVFPDDGATTDELLVSADAAMYRAKEVGGASFELFNPRLATQAHARLRLESALHAGIDDGQLVLHYQPTYDLDSGRIVGAEALVRWEHPERGLLLPAHFVPVAERSDLVVRMGERVILDACRELRRWKDLGLGGRYLAVNVSSRHFGRGLVSTVAAALRATGADPEDLVIELTESTAAENLTVVAAALEELREMGVKSAIDDFGTGYCGLRYLGSLPVDALKIDKSFVQGMTPSDAAIVSATIAMGHSLGLVVVAEGVETEEQRRFLSTQGCDRMQGYLLAKPMPPEAFVDLVRAEAPMRPRAVSNLPIGADDRVVRPFKVPEAAG